MRTMFKAAFIYGLLSTAAFAADVAKPTVYSAAPAAPWTGLYGGLHAGYVSGDPAITSLNGGVATQGIPIAFNVSGGFGGGQIGYNKQFGIFVVGIEGDVGYMGLTGKGRIQSANPNAYQALTLDSGVYGDITGRVGIAFDSLLIYGKGGAAWFDGRAAQTTTNAGYVTTPTGTFSGYTVGGGLEYLLGRNVSVKVEYQYFDFGPERGKQTSISDPPIGFQYFTETKLDMHTVKAGLNWHLPY